MTVELNKTYETRGGENVKITDLNYIYDRPFFGLIKTKENKVVRPASFNVGGFYKNGEESPFDLIKEIEE
jgi:hypothetical protein